MKIELEQVAPKEIEAKSFEIITQELGEHVDQPLVPGTEAIVKRCIHTSADFDYAKNLCFSEGVVEQALEAIRGGASIVTDTQMAKAGINKKSLGGGQNGESCSHGGGSDLCHRERAHGFGAAV